MKGLLPGVQTGRSRPRDTAAGMLGARTQEGSDEDHQRPHPDRGDRGGGATGSHQGHGSDARQLPGRHICHGPDDPG